MAARRRLTVSLVITGEVASEIDGIRRALGAGSLDRISPHVTLVPPVNVRDDALDEAVDIVRLAAQESRPLRLDLGPTATFWPGAPVVYLPVGGDLQGIDDLRARLLTGPLARDDDRRFVPHVTLDQRIEPERIEAALDTLARYEASIVVERVTILELREHERRWRPLTTAALGRPKVVGRGGLEVELSVSSMLDPAGQQFQDREWAQYSRETYGDAVADEEPFAVTARVAGAIAGTASGQLRGPMCRIANLVVASRGSR